MPVRFTWCLGVLAVSALGLNSGNATEIIHRGCTELKPQPPTDLERGGWDVYLRQNITEGYSFFLVITRRVLQNRLSHLFYPVSNFYHAMAWVRPKRKPAPKKIVDPEARRNTLQYFSCGHQPQKRNHDRLKSSDLVILEPKRQRNPLAYLDENDPLVKSMLASQRHSSQSKVHIPRAPTQDNIDVIVVEEEEDSVEQGRQTLPRRAQRRVITAPPREYAHIRPTYMDTGEHRHPEYHSLIDHPHRHSQFEPQSLGARQSRSGSRWSSAITPLRL
ncbi:MAG: hypothetical protein LQ352_005684 [Teloschistes flavicans]|nr:MAG: hypothetical protein LQ352_005684 [Teloschistes flavicans]